MDAGQHTPTKSTATKAIVVLLTFGHIGLWGIAIIIFASLGVGMEKSISDAQSAPHQAAAAAMGVGEIAIAYCVVRGVSEILKTLLKSADVVL
nr:hypothetical protein [uncultured bacterium]